MKIWCDVCDREEASVFCSADEAALCHGCDHRVHSANKLASKHTRFSLVVPNFKEAVLCDICQERRALLFCQEDRAIICRECDVPIHQTNQHTQKHNRFLLTGIKLSATSPFPSSPSFSTSFKNRHSSVSSEVSGSSPTIQPLRTDCFTSDLGSVSTSSFSEYLMESIPGWEVDEFFT